MKNSTEKIILIATCTCVTLVTACIIVWAVHNQNINNAKLDALNNNMLTKLDQLGKSIQESSDASTKFVTKMTLAGAKNLLNSCATALNQVEASGYTYTNLYTPLNNDNNEASRDSESPQLQLLETALMRKLNVIINTHETIFKQIDDNFTTHPFYTKIISRREVLSTANGDLQSMKDSLAIIASNQEKLEKIIQAM